jgi:hypothetical protein
MGLDRAIVASVTGGSRRQESLLPSTKALTGPEAGKCRTKRHAIAWQHF